METIQSYWYLWIIGIFIFPLIAILPQIDNIHKAIDYKGDNPDEIGKLFVSVKGIFTIVIGGIGTFICLILFITSLIIGLIDYIKS